MANVPRMVAIELGWNTSLLCGCVPSLHFFKSSSKGEYLQIALLRNPANYEHHTWDMHTRVEWH